MAPKHMWTNWWSWEAEVIPNIRKTNRVLCGFTICSAIHSAKGGVGGHGGLTLPLGKGRAWVGGEN